MSSLRPAMKANRGYRSARTLLGSRYLRASVAARVALLEAADFLVRVLEMMPPQ
jgi:hypothetical protein